MPEEQDFFSTPFVAEINSRISDLEEKQRLMRDRILLIGRNLVEFREEIEEEVARIKADLEVVKENIEKLRQAFFRLGDEIEKRARKEELEILENHIRMLEPLKFIGDEKEKTKKQ